MWEKEEDRLFALALAVALLSEETALLDRSHIKGTICKEKGQGRITVDVLGTGDRIALTMDNNTKTNLNGKVVSVHKLPIGTYVEAEYEESTIGRFEIRKIKTDISKTVISFHEIIKKRKMRNILENIKGVSNYKIYDASLQVYVEYNPEVVNYKGIEQAIYEAGFKVEIK